MWGYIIGYFITFIVGILVYVLGRFIEKFILDPWKDQRQAIGEVVDLLLFNAEVYSNPKYLVRDIQNTEYQKVQEIRKMIRKASANLISKTYSVYFYNFFAKIFNGPSKIELHIAGKLLVELSNNLMAREKIDFVTSRDNIERRQQILTALHAWKFIESMVDKQPSAANL